ncbi:MAG: tyrosine-type recombinase/integrase [Caldilineaceae bacterium]|nr:tyrosine-type recombinase/integrase [Caldilineaceae bacterium]
MLLTPQERKVEDILIFPNLDRWIETYLQDCMITLRKEETLRHYNNALKRFALWYTTRLPDGQITRTSAKDFAYWLSRVKQKYDDHPGRPTESHGLSPVTVRRTVGVIRTFLTWLFEEGCLPRDVSCWFPLPRVSAVRTKTISTETLQALLNAATESELSVRDVAMISLLADTGLRRAELAQLQVDQVQLLTTDGRGCLLDVLGKGDRLRMIPFSATVGQILRHYLAYREALVQHMPGAKALFVQQNGQPLQPGSVYQVLRRVAIRAGVEEEIWNTHSLRHSFATHFWRVQRDTKSLSVMLGHSSQKITEDIYVHPVSQDLIEAHTSPVAVGAVQPAVGLDIRQPPRKEELQQAIQANPNWRALAERYHMSDSGVRKLAKRYGILEEYYLARRRR